MQPRATVQVAASANNLAVNCLWTVDKSGRSRGWPDIVTWRKGQFSVIYRTLLGFPIIQIVDFCRKLGMQCLIGGGVLIRQRRIHAVLLGRYDSLREGTA